MGLRASCKGVYYLVNTLLFFFFPRYVYEDHILNVIYRKGAAKRQEFLGIFTSKITFIQNCIQGYDRIFYALTKYYLMKEITYLVMEIQMDEIIHTNSAATAPTTFTACFLKNQLTLWLRKAAHALSFGTLIPLTSEEEFQSNFTAGH